MKNCEGIFFLTRYQQKSPGKNAGAFSGIISFKTIE